MCYILACTKCQLRCDSGWLESNMIASPIEIKHSTLKFKVALQFYIFKPGLYFVMKVPVVLTALLKIHSTAILEYT